METRKAHQMCFCVAKQDLSSQDSSQTIVATVEEDFEQRGDCLRRRVSQPQGQLVEECFSPGAQKGLQHLTVCRGNLQVRLQIASNYAMH